MYVVEEMFLLLRRDDGKSESALAQNGFALAGAALTDLMLAERITCSDDRDPRVQVTSARPLGHLALDAALVRVQERDGKRLGSLVMDRRMNVEEQTAEELARAEVVTIEPKRGLGMVPAKYPTVDPAPERATRERLRGVLAGASPGPADGAILSILQGVDLAARVLAEERGAMSRRDLKRRIKEVAEDAPAGSAVARAVQSMNAAIAAGAAVAVSGSASG